MQSLGKETKIMQEESENNHDLRSYVSIVTGQIDKAR